jgi:uncharacterized protein
MNAYALKMRDALRKFKEGAVMRLDGWVNTATGFGTSRDKSEYGFVLPSRILTDTELSTLYHADDMAQRMVDVVPTEMLREGFSFETGDPLVDAALNDKFDTLEAPAKFSEGIRWGRCFGGAGILIGADDGRDSELPLIPEKADDITFLYVIDRRMLWPMSYYDEPGDPKLGQPKTYLVTTMGGTHFNTAICHESRLVLFRGANTGIRERMQLMGWDMSVLQRIYDVLRSFNTGWKSVETLLVDGNQAIFKMTGLAESLSSGGEEILRARMQAMDLYRSVMRAMVIDADGKEAFERQAANFSGIPDTLDKFMLRLAAAVQIPVTILMGQSPAGMNATGDSDFRWFYDRIKAEQTMMLAPKIKRVGKIWLRTRAGQEYTSKAAKMMNVKFPALWTETPSVQATRENTIATRDKTYIDSQVLSPEEVALHRFGSPDGFDREILITPEAIEARKAVLTEDIAKMAEPAAEEVVDPLAVDPNAPSEAASQNSMLKLTASDLASIVKVNEARASVGLPPLAGDEGNMTLPQFKAKYAATIAAAVTAEKGTNPNAPPPEVPPEKPTFDATNAHVFETLGVFERLISERTDAKGLRTFVLRRKVDETGVSGTGDVAEGCVFADGKVAMRWKTKTASTTFFDSIDDAIKVHGHDGKTTIVYDDERTDGGDDQPRDENGRFAGGEGGGESSGGGGGSSGGGSSGPAPSSEAAHAHLGAGMKHMNEELNTYHGKNAERAELFAKAANEFAKGVDMLAHPGVKEPLPGNLQHQLDKANKGAAKAFSAAAKDAKAKKDKEGEARLKAKAAAHAAAAKGGPTPRLDGWEEQERDELGRFGSGGGSAVEKAIASAEGGGRATVSSPSHEAAVARGATAEMKAANYAAARAAFGQAHSSAEKLPAAKNLVAATLARGVSRDNKPVTLRNIPVEEHAAIAKEVADAHAKEFAETKAQIASFAPKDAQVMGRTKKLDSVIEKLDRKADKYTDAHSLQDTTGLRVITKDLDGMKQTVANLEASGLKVVEKDDYVAKPKADSGYRSVHLIVQTPSGLQKEVQIRTADQHAHAEFAHDVYKPQTDAQAAFLRQHGPAVEKYSVDLGNHYQAIGEGKPSTPPTPPPGLHEAFPKAPKH